MTIIRAEWSIWLRQFSAELIDRLDLDRPDAFRHEAVTAARAASGWLGEAGLDEGELAGLEARLGVALPPSYRSLLAASNGFLLPASSFRARLRPRRSPGIERWIRRPSKPGPRSPSRDRPRVNSATVC